MRTNQFSIAVGALALIAIAALSAPRALAQRPGDEDTVAERSFPVHGVESTDDENEESEPDTRFGRPLLRPLPKGATASGAGAGEGDAGGAGHKGGNTPLAAHANAGEILDDLIEGLRELEVDVQLLGGRKYMVNSCLGIKVSAGGFRLKLGDTVGRFQGSSLIIETAIDKVSISAVKIRMRPNPNVLELCSFSKKFEIGGDLDDVTLKLVFDPVLNAEQNRIVGIGQPQVTVRIGNLNLKPLQNNLDAMAKNAVEDSLTVFLNIQFVDLIHDLIRRILDPGAVVTGGRDLVEGRKIGGGVGAATGSGVASGDLEARIAELERRVAELEKRLEGAGGDAAASGASSPASGGRGLIGRLERVRAPVDSKSYEIVDAPDLKGRLGRLVLAFPEGTTELKVTTQLFPPGDEKAVRTDYGPFSAEITPGTYDIEIGGRRVSGVPVESRRDTRLRAGVLRIHSTGNTTFQIFEPGAEKAFQTVYGASELGLPPGPVEIVVNGQRETIEIRAGEIVEY